MPKGGSKAKRQKLRDARSNAVLRPGPRTSDELFAWPQQIVEDLFCRGDGCVERQQCMLEHLNAGLIGVSEFSGWDAQEEALRLTTLAFDAAVAASPTRGFAWVLVFEV
eukprot:2374042-Amphidinium_carterae.2